MAEKFQRGRTEEEKAGKMMRKKGRLGVKQRKSIPIERDTTAAGRGTDQQRREKDKSVCEYITTLSWTADSKQE